ncbi:MAG: hypothetical protein AAB928_01645 [Patescibacteria group bacterium]
MKLLIVGRKPQEAAALLKKHGGAFRIVNTNPEAVVSYGGDGTLMESEYRYPGVPKLYLRNSRIGKLGHHKDNAAIIDHLAKGEYVISEHIKLEVSKSKKTLTGLNDIVVHNKDPRHAIRYTVSLNGDLMGGEIIGDGVVLATPLGSTGYYRSITDSYFESGIGLAFNNSTEQSDHIVLGENRVVTIEITRGPAVCYADNQKKFLELKEGDAVRVEKSSQVARIIKI